MEERVRLTREGICWSIVAALKGKNRSLKGWWSSEGVVWVYGGGRVGDCVSVLGGVVRGEES